MASKDKWSTFPDVTEEQLKIIITTSNGAETLIKVAKNIGKDLAKGNRLTTSQIRNIFGEVRRIEGEWQGKKSKAKAAQQLILLKPKMAYRAKKEKGKGVEDLVSVLSPAINLVGENDQHFTNFVNFFEAILAYHQAAGGK